MLILRVALEDHAVRDAHADLEGVAREGLAAQDAREDLEHTRTQKKLVANHKMPLFTQAG